MRAVPEDNIDLHTVYGPLLYRMGRVVFHSAKINLFKINRSEKSQAYT